MPTDHTWRTAGFEDFGAGSCGNAGENLYVSHAGILQRIHQFDVNADGYFDVIFCNSQEQWEAPPVHVYHDPLGTCQLQLLPADGALAGVVADLNDDGFDDLVLGMGYDGNRTDLNAVIYYGSADGWREQRTQRLPAPECQRVAAGMIGADQRPALIFLCGKGRHGFDPGFVRVFAQTELGFEPKQFTDLPLPAADLALADLTGSGRSSLLILTADGAVTVYWDGPGAAGATTLPVRAAAIRPDKPGYTEAALDNRPLLRVIRLAGVPHIFVPGLETASLVPVYPDRRFGEPLTFNVRRPMSVAVGDITGNGNRDLAFACRDNDRSWIYWGNDHGFDEQRRTPLATSQACDVVLADLTGNGCDEVIVCQGASKLSYTSEALVFAAASGGIGEQDPLPLTAHDAREILVARPAGETLPAVVLVNARARGRKGDVPICCYLGGADGFDPARRLKLRGRDTVAALCCDLNDDGRVDIVTANCCECAPWDDVGSFIFYQNANGFSFEPSLRLPTTRAHGVCCADIDRDGYLELIYVGFDNPELLIFRQGEDGFNLDKPTRLRLERDGVECREGRWILLADLNNSGYLDLFVPLIDSERSLILWGGPGGFEMSRSDWLSIGRGSCARAVDLTGNGYLDLIVGGHQPTRDHPHDSFVYIYWNGPDGLRQDNRMLLPAKAVNSLAIADFDNDGLLDLFVCSYQDVLERDVDSYIYWNREGRGFSASDRLPLRTHSASGCIAADFNGDGYVDLAVANHKVFGDHVGYSCIWWNGPGGFDSSRVTRLPTSGPHGMVNTQPFNSLSGGNEEYYVSIPYRMPDGAAGCRFDWTAEVPETTWVRAQLRVAATADALAAADWCAEQYDAGAVVDLTAMPGPWLQYRLALGATMAMRTPRVSAVQLDFF